MNIERKVSNAAVAKTVQWITKDNASPLPGKHILKANMQ